ncbi:hypothetical protein BDZ85DRAFT_126899 [Elsinoe ampelina]|uniref:FAD-binding PCMH-type domain-containing protein n=1 Tax=Elsinoe ampelina TaxID=302913 RepID=A0A6A6G9G0_9PEZI|nr:hypothetical protein BDZ85DRAFT_126899 [Elsinoe ampelina]
MLLTRSLLLVGAIPSLINGQSNQQIVLQDIHHDTPETSDFDIVQALKDRSIDVSTVPVLAKLTEETKSSKETACAAACSALDFMYAKNEIITASSPDIETFVKRFWSNNQAETLPACVFKPVDAEAVSVVVLLSRLTQCPFAVKSGGHASFPGASNIQGGITVSFERMKSFQVSEDKSTVTIEPGWKWGPLYRELGSHDLTVVGGRVASVGVGGLITGGGISFFSNLHGWACDNIASLTLVTSTGAIITVSATSNPTLFSALRGAGPNLGIVTSFTLRTIPLPAGQIWGGTRTYLPDTYPSLIHAFTTLSSSSTLDPNAGAWISFVRYNGTDIALAELYYARPDGHNATIWQNFDAVPSIASTTENRHIADYAAKVEADAPPGHRQYFYVMTVKNSHEMNTAAMQLYYDAIAQVEQYEGGFGAFVLQSISTEQLRHMKRDGGNTLGLDAEDEALTLILLNPRWSNKEDDEGMYRFGSDLFKRIKEAAVERGCEKGYLYMNYASEFQDVVASYGSAGERLREVAREWDPRGVWQRLMPGYFKLDGAPTRGTGMFSF